MKFLHAADIHLDSPLDGLERYEGAPVDQIRGATRRALENLVRVAIEEQVDFVVIAGDLYDDDWKDHNTGLFFSRQMARLREAEIPMYLIAGNHDAANKMTRALRLPSNPDGSSPVLSHEQPETRLLDARGVAIHGRSFANQKETNNIVLDYPQAISGYFNVGLLHTCLSGESDHARYAPCDEADLRAKGYDYWALGHIHKRTRLPSEGLPLPDPIALFSGNIQGRHIKETGAKGCLIVEFDDRHHVTVRFEPLDVFRWEVCRVPCSDLTTADDVLSCFAAELQMLLATHAPLPLGLRVVFEGACAAHRELLGDPIRWTNEVRNSANELSVERVWIEKVLFQTTDVRESTSSWTEDGPLGELVRFLDELPGDQSALARLSEELKDIDKKLRSERIDVLAIDQPEWLQQTLQELKPMLVKKLEGG